MPEYIPFSHHTYLHGAICCQHLCLSDLLLSGDDPETRARQWAQSAGDTAAIRIPARFRRGWCVCDGFGQGS